MSRLFITVSTLAIVAAGAAASYAYLGQRPAAAAPEESVQTTSAETFQLRSNEASGSCAVTRGDEVGGGRAELKVDASCAALLPGVEKARFWLDKADGSVTFTENGVDPIVTFAIADGVAYESLEPAQPVISLDAEAPADEIAAE